MDLLDLHRIVIYEGNITSRQISGKLLILEIQYVRLLVTQSLLLTTSKFTSDSYNASLIIEILYCSHFNVQLALSTSSLFLTCEFVWVPTSGRTDESGSEIH